MAMSVPTLYMPSPIDVFGAAGLSAPAGYQSLQSVEVKILSVGLIVT